VKLNTNPWNRFRYTLWAPFYDLVGRRLDGQRQRSLQMLEAKPRDRILLVGAGTGADLPYLPSGCRVLATDLTKAMLARARPHVREGVYLALMDGHVLAAPSAAYDAVVLHLILAVIPDPVKCLQEAARVLRPGGRMVVFDKFVRGARPPLLLRVANLVTSVLFTEVTRRFEDILERSYAPLEVVSDEPALLGGLFRRVLLVRA
jgi:ubiquinone/menaquinone biosynthesis C-methylase UbiE